MILCALIVLTGLTTAIAITKPVLIFNATSRQKKVLREFLRKALDEYESSLAKQIEEDIDYDQKSVWSIINKRKKKTFYL